jgi:hypothetical protein
MGLEGEAIPPVGPEGEDAERGEAGAPTERSGDLGPPQEPIGGLFGEPPDPGTLEGCLSSRDPAPAGSADPE